MPALITHDFFGRDVYDRLYTFIGGSRDEADAFLLGNQGPDPLFYLVLSPQLRAHNRLGSTMHNKKPSELLTALKNSLGILNSAEREVGRAYALGFLCHYTLDSTMHPFVYFHEYRLCDAGVPGLTRADGSEVHGTIESSNFALHVISKMYAYVALTVYGEIVPADLFETAVKDFRVAQRVFYSPSGRKRALFGRVEELLRPFSFYKSMSHRPVALTESQFDNRARETWENPFTGDMSTASFWDLFDEALGKAQDNLFAFDEDGFDLAAARAITNERDFSGEPVVALVVSVEDGAADAQPQPADEA